MTNGKSKILSPPPWARPIWKCHQITDQHEKIKFKQYFSAWYSKLLKDLLNYADEEEEIKGEHIQFQK